jgi:hypothetical protein
MTGGLSRNPFQDEPGRLARLVREATELISARAPTLVVPPDGDDPVAEVAAEDLLWGVVANALSEEERAWLRL